MRAAWFEKDKSPAGMVWVPGASSWFLAMPGLDGLPVVTLAPYWIDKFEVTNREYQLRGVLNNDLLNFLNTGIAAATAIARVVAW